ncbi:MAG: GNAT family N-acetyltransferase [Myxococcota bacterium]|nr:GNAT family N-acetyltransferase [Myxococcota bacterium]
MTAEKDCGYRIEPGKEEMAESLSAIDLRSNALFPEEDLPSPQREWALSPSYFEESASQGRLWVAVDLESTEPVGFAAMARLDGCAHLFQLSVLPEHGRKGVGTRLVEETIRQAREQGDSDLILTTFSHLPWNAPFYERLGFRNVKAREMGPGLRACLEKEAQEGLDPAKRVAMKRSLSSS